MTMLSRIALLFLLLLSLPGHTQLFGPFQEVASLIDASDVQEADIDGDGDLDIVFGTISAQRVGWIPNEGAGSFGAPRIIAVGIDHPGAIDVADMDGDGDLDVINTALNDDQVMWHENVGAGQFPFPARLITSFLEPRDVEAEDMDGDGDPDIMVAGEQGLGYLPNLGMANMGIMQMLPVSFYLGEQVGVHDVDSDGDLDITFLSTQLDLTLIWFPNDGQGVFGPSSIASSSLHGYAFGDMDGDMDQDLVKLDGGEIELRINNGSEIFMGTPPIAGVTSVQVIELADLDDDGDLDIALGRLVGSTAWLENDGLGNFGPVNEMPPSSLDEARAIGVADLDNDGHLDIFGSNHLKHQIMWHRGDGLGGFTTFPIHASKVVVPFEMTAADLSGDGHAELISSTVNDPGSVVLANDGNERFKFSGILDTNWIPINDLHVADMDGDGDNDVLSAVGFTNPILFHENDGTGIFTTTHFVAATMELTDDLYTADLDGDGDLDVLAAEGAGDRVSWFENLGGGSFGNINIISTNDDATASVFAADLDGDGDQDVISSSHVDDQVVWYANDGSGSFGPRQVVTSQVVGTQQVWAADMDGDLDMDVLSYSASNGDLAWHANDGSGAFGAPNVVQNAPNFGGMNVADLDNDGDQDVVVHWKSEPNAVNYYLNQGNGTFAPRAEMAGPQISSLTIVDMDNDGDLDLAVGSQWDDQLGWYENHGAGCTPFSGTYVIGGSTGADFTTFSEAIQQLTSCGVGGSVVFEVESGTYQEKVELGAINGTSAQNTVTFRSQSLDAEDVVLRWYTQGISDSDALIELDSAGWVGFSHMTLRREGGGILGPVVHMVNDAHDITLSHLGMSPQLGLTQALFIDGFFDIGTTTLSDCVIEGTEGVKLEGPSGGSFHMRDNTISNSRGGMELAHSWCDVVCSNNRIELADAPNTIGIYVHQQTQGDVLIERNTIKGIGTFCTGIVFDHLNGSPTTPYRSQNNMITVTGPNSSGIEVFDNVSNLHLAHNSVSVTTGMLMDRALLITGSTGSNITLQNNAFRNEMIAVEVNTSGRVSASDHNLYFSAIGSPNVQWGGFGYSDVPSLFAATGMDGSSLMQDPLYVDPFGDLHLQAGSPCLGAGMTLGAISYDLDGSQRPWPAASQSDIGADEDAPMQAVVRLRALLEGPFDPGSGLMDDQLRVQGLIPLNEPFTALGHSWVSGGGETTTNMVLNGLGGLPIVDWVLVQLRDPDDPTIVIADQAALIDRTGQVLGNDGGILNFPLASGPYHVALLHRNHLGCMTRDPLHLAYADPLRSLSDGTTPAWGEGALQDINGDLVLWSGDVGFNGELKYTGLGNDRDPILVSIGGSIPTNTITGYHSEDVNMDGTVQYTGLGNDRDPILVNIGGSVPTNVRAEQLP